MRQQKAALALLSGWSGQDYARPLDDQTPSEAIEAAAPDAARDIDAAARHVALAGSCPLVVGSPDHVAVELESRREDAGVDGFNVTRQVMPESFVDFVALVVPELQRRGVLERAYAPGTLREKLFGRGAHLRPPHPPATLFAGGRAQRERGAGNGSGSAKRRSTFVVMRATSLS